MGQPLGQHFLANARFARKIVERAALPYRFPVLEIGPGRGALTRWFLKAGHPVLAVEIDPELAAFLRSHFHHCSDFRVIEGDILKLDWLSLVRSHFEPPEVIVVGNLPYQISSPILERLQRYTRIWHQAVLMFQKEFAERLLALHGTSHYGALSVIAQTFWHLEKILEVQPGAFMPPPKVQSLVLRFRHRSDVPADCHHPGFSQFVHACFRHRRKTLMNNLKRFLPSDGVQKAVHWLQQNGFTPTTRPQDLPPEAWPTLFEALSTVELHSFP